MAVIPTCVCFERRVMASCRRAVQRFPTWKSNALSGIPCGRGQSIETPEDDAGGRRLGLATRQRVGWRRNSRDQEAADPVALYPRVILLMNVCVRREDGFLRGSEPPIPLMAQNRCTDRRFTLCSPRREGPPLRLLEKDPGVRILASSTGTAVYLEESGDFGAFAGTLALWGGGVCSLGQIAAAGSD